MNKPPIPELPKTTEELESLLKKEFETLSATEPVSVLTGAESCYGDQTIATSERKCPFCRMRFEATIESDLLGNIFDPDYCPYCSFPNNVAYALSHNKRNKKKEG
jgi:hypothetical protein